MSAVPKAKAKSKATPKALNSAMKRKSSQTPATGGQQGICTNIKGANDSILTVFRRFDMNGDNCLELHELATVLKALDPGTWSDEKITRLFDDMDLDFNGRISADEFVRWATAPDATKDAECGAVEFMGAFELAKTPHAPHTIASAAASAVEPSYARDLPGDLRRIKGADVAREVGEISSSELEQVRKLMSAPEPMRRTVEAVYLLLGPSKGGGSDALRPPEWAKVQKVLGDHSFLQRVRNVGARRAELQRSPMLASYVADVYFGAHGMEGQEPLTYHRVLKTSQTQFGLTEGREGPVVKLYRWCLSLLEPELRELLEFEADEAKKEKAAEDERKAKTKTREEEKQDDPELVEKAEKIEGPDLAPA